VLHRLTTTDRTTAGPASGRGPAWEPGGDPTRARPHRLSRTPAPRSTGPRSAVVTLTFCGEVIHSRRLSTARRRSVARLVALRQARARRRGHSLAAPATARCRHPMVGSCQ
jgi:hypothetical protein